MPHAKLPRKSTHIDMTAMCDVAFLLLTFFMLATKFKPDEPVVVKTPSSISEIILPDVDVMLLTVDAKGRIFFSIDNKLKRKDLIDQIDYEKELKLTDAEKTSFALGSLKVKEYLFFLKLSFEVNSSRSIPKSSALTPVCSNVTVTPGVSEITSMFELRMNCMSGAA